MVIRGLVLLVNMRLGSDVLLSYLSGSTSGGVQYLVQLSVYLKGINALEYTLLANQHGVLNNAVV